MQHCCQLMKININIFYFWAFNFGGFKWIKEGICHNEGGKGLHHCCVTVYESLNSENLATKEKKKLTCGLRVKMVWKDMLEPRGVRCKLLWCWARKLFNRDRERQTNILDRENTAEIQGKKEAEMWCLLHTRYLAKWRK